MMQTTQYCVRWLTFLERMEIPDQDRLGRAVEIRRHPDEAAAPTALALHFPWPTHLYVPLMIVIAKSRPFSRGMIRLQYLHTIAGLTDYILLIHHNDTGATAFRTFVLHFSVFAATTVASGGS